jgi:hypothetical protein
MQSLWRRRARGARGLEFRVSGPEFTETSRAVLFSYHSSAKPETRNPKLETLLVSGEPPVIDHQSTVLHDLDSRFGENLRR